MGHVRGIFSEKRKIRDGGASMYARARERAAHERARGGHSRPQRFYTCHVSPAESPRCIASSVRMTLVARGCWRGNGRRAREGPSVWAEFEQRGLMLSPDFRPRLCGACPLCRWRVAVSLWCMCAERVCACVCAYVRACVRACVRALSLLAGITHRERPRHTTTVYGR